MGEAAEADEGLEPIPPFEEPAEPAPAAGLQVRDVLFKMWNCVHFVSVQMLKMKSMGQCSSSSAILPSHGDGRLKKGWIVVIFLWKILAP